MGALIQSTTDVSVLFFIEFSALNSMHNLQHDQTNKMTKKQGPTLEYNQGLLLPPNLVPEHQNIAFVNVRSPFLTFIFPTEGKPPFEPLNTECQKSF